MARKALLSLAAIVFLIVGTVLLKDRLITNETIDEKIGADSFRTPARSSEPSPVQPEQVRPAQKATASADVIPTVPEAAPQLPEMTLWQPDPVEPDTTFDGHPAKRLQTDPELLEGMHVGQNIHLQIPQRNQVFEVKIDSTSNMGPSVQIWQGKILAGQPGDNVIMTRGELETHVAIATHEGTYTAVIDNATGETVLVDEGDITVDQIPYEDGIAVEPIEGLPPVVEP